MKKTVQWLSAAGVALLGTSHALAQTAPTKWQSRAIEASQGLIKVIDGKEVQIRYREGPYSGVPNNWAAYRTHAYDDNRPEPPVTKAKMPAGIKGDEKKGYALFTSRAKGPCTACHVVRPDFWPMGNIGPDFTKYGEVGRSDEEIYQLIYDIRVHFPKSIMPPWGVIGVYTPEDIVHMVAFLKSQKGPEVKRKDPNIDPKTRAMPVGFGDNLDPTNNPAVLLAEARRALWTKAGPNGKSCASAGCHTGGVESMKGVATKWPKYVAKYGRVMSIDDFLGPHGEDTMGGNVLPPQSEDNIHLTALIKMQSTGMPVQLDLNSPEIKAALERGKATFNKRVGLRNHACADCHTAEKGGGKFLGGRLLGLATAPLTHHFPTYRTNFTRSWDIRKRFQWCMLPLGMNFIPGDSVEYAELELYLTSLGQNKPLNVPGIGH